jgi:hypothetical protein
VPQNSSERVNLVSKTIKVTISEGSAILAKIGSDGAINAKMEQTTPVIVGSDTAIPCSSSDWVESDGYYIFTIPTSAHLRGFNARAVGAESNDADAIVSYHRLPNGDLSIYSNIPFEGKIFIR